MKNSGDSDVNPFAALTPAQRQVWKDRTAREKRAADILNQDFDDPMAPDSPYSRYHLGTAIIKKESASYKYDQCAPEWMEDGAESEPETRHLEIPLTEAEWTLLHDYLLDSFSDTKLHTLAQRIGTWDSWLEYKV